MPAPRKLTISVLIACTAIIVASVLLIGAWVYRGNQIAEERQRQTDLICSRQEAVIAAVALLAVDHQHLRASRVLAKLNSAAMTPCAID